MPAALVLTEPVRSAEPPIISGIAAVKASSASWLALRVAQVGFSSARRRFSPPSTLLEARRQLAGLDPLELGPVLRRPAGQAILPGGAARAPRAPNPRQAARIVLRDLERRMRPAELASGRRHLVRAERRAMGRGGARLVRRAVADGRAARDQDGPIGALRLGQRRLDRRRDRGRRPRATRQPIRLEPLERILGDGERGRAVDRDVVVVEQHDQAVEALMAGERAGLVADPLHEVAVARDHVGAVVDQIGAEAGAQMALRERHADRIGEALAERPGGGLDAGRVAELGMAGGLRAELAKALDLGEVDPGIAGQVQERVQQHRAMAGRQHEAVAIGPLRRRRIEAQELPEQHGGDVRHAHGHAGVAGLGRLHRVHRQRADGVGQVLVAGLGGRAALEGEAAVMGGGQACSIGVRRPADRRDEPNRRLGENLTHPRQKSTRFLKPRAGRRRSPAS